MTLVELTAGMVIMTILSAALMSAMLIASHALPDRKPAEERAVAAAEALERLAGDLTFATSITTLTDREIVFTVADRGEGLAGPETIRYAWNGNPGGALLRVQNAGTADTLVDSVTSFVITPRPAMKPVTQPPRLLMVVADQMSKSINDLARENMLISWGFTVQSMSDDLVEANLPAAVPNLDVLYLTGEIGNAVNIASADARIGVVADTCAANAPLGLSSGCNSTPNTGMIVVDDQHEITDGKAVGLNVSLTLTNQACATVSGPATGIHLLGEGTTGAAILFVVDLGGELNTGGFAKARRVRMPWGLSSASPFPVDQLSSDGKTFLRRSLSWASATPVVAGVKISVQPGDPSDPGAAVVETEISILNQPRDPRP